MDQVAAANHWWVDLPDERKVQIHRWIEAPRETRIPGQPELFEEWN